MSLISDDADGTDIQRIPVRRLLGAIGRLSFGSVVFVFVGALFLLGVSFGIGKWWERNSAVGFGVRKNSPMAIDARDSGTVFPFREGGSTYSAVKETAAFDTTVGVRRAVPVRSNSIGVRDAVARWSSRAIAMGVRNESLETVLASTEVQLRQLRTGAIRERISDLETEKDDLLGDEENLVQNVSNLRVNQADAAERCRDNRTRGRVLDAEECARAGRDSAEAAILQQQLDAVRDRLRAIQDAIHRLHAQL